jgi:hypothetical protein
MAVGKDQSAGFGDKDICTHHPIRNVCHKIPDADGEFPLPVPEIIVKLSISTELAALRCQNRNHW